MLIKGNTMHNNNNNNRNTCNHLKLDEGNI
jgi:hypothetical protein